VALEVHYHKVCYCNYTKFLTRGTKKQSETERSTSVYEKSYDVFCKKVIETEVIGNKQIKYMKICWRNVLSLLRTLRMWTHLNIELILAKFISHAGIFGFPKMART
jgi:hypothetical protein